jgi:purine-binding chemotaxis protein CheW
METMQAKAGQYLTFHLADRPYGVPIASVREINRIGDIAPVPQAPAFVAGVMNLRGKVIPVVNLRNKFGFSDTTHTRQTCIIVIEGQDGQVGVIVDSVAGVVELASEMIEPPPQMGEVRRVDFVLGMGKQESGVIILVDAVKALAKENLSVQLAMHEASQAA